MHGSCKRCWHFRARAVNGLHEILWPTCKRFVSILTKVAVRYRAAMIENALVRVMSENLSRKRMWIKNTTDVDDIKYVINFDFPNSSEDYVHRIGRTARASKRGTSYTFFTVANARQAKDLIGVLQEAHQQINPKLVQMQQMAGTFGGRSRDRRGGGSGRGGGFGRGGGGSSRGGPRGGSRGGGGPPRSSMGGSRGGGFASSRPPQMRSVVGSYSGHY